MLEAGFDFYGLTVRLAGETSAVLEALGRDFEHFLAPQARRDARAIRLTLELRPAPQPPHGWPFFRTKDYAVFDQGGLRRIFYTDRAYAEYDFAARRGRIRCADAERLRELAYLAVLSRVGEALDRRGWHRIHALGFESRGRGGLLLLPSGAGKSVLALELLRSTGLGLLSDDTPLLTRDMRLLAFPLRLGFRPTADLGGVPERWIRSMRRRHYGVKRLVDFGFFRERVKSDIPAAWLLVGERQDNAAPRIEPVSRVRAAGTLAAHLVVGAGIAQMSEYMLRPAPSELRPLLKIARSRLATALRLLRSTRPHRFVLGPNPHANAAALRAFVTMGDGLTQGLQEC